MRLNATLHCHGPWTDMASGKFDIEKFPRDIETVADLGIEKGLDIIGLTDISGKEGVCEIFKPLVEWHRQDRYEVINQTEISYSILRKKDGKRIDFGKGIEILASDAHVLVLGTEGDICGGRELEEVIYEAREKKGVIIADHPCYTIKLGKGMGEQRVRKFHEKGLIDAVEVNANIVNFLESIGHYNEKAIKLGRELNLPVIANCDGNRAIDLGIMSTFYLFYNETSYNSADRFKEILNLIKEGKYDESKFLIRGKPKSFISLPLHVVRGLYSIYRGKKGWIEKGLPAC